MADSSKEHSPHFASAKESDDEGKQNNNNSSSNSSSEDANFDQSSNLSDHDSDEVSLMVVDEEELASVMQEAGISIQVSCVSLQQAIQ